jgi:MFS family permease
MSILAPDPAGLKLGPFWFVPGLTRGNVATVLVAAFCTMAVNTFMSFTQPYVLTEILNVPQARQGVLTGYLGSIQEVIVIAVMGFFGAWSDRVGRRLVFVVGLLLFAFGYFIYPLASSETQLMIFRAIFALGSASAPILLSITIHDSCQELSRGKWVALNSIATGMGVLFMALVLAKTPAWFSSLGADPAMAGRFAFWSTSGICVLAAVFIWFGMKNWVVPRFPQPHIFRQVGDGFRSGLKNPRLAIAFGAAFVGRGDLVIVSTFLSLWVVQFGTDQGLSTGQGLARAGMLFGIVQGTALLWAAVMGAISDRFDRLSALCVSLIIATAGYCGIGLIEDPLARSMIPAAMLLGIGEISVLIAAGALLGQEAQEEKRGAVVGVFGLLGGTGILFAVFFGGIVFDAIGRTAPFVMMGCLNFLLFIAALVVRLRGYQPGGQQEAPAKG